MSLRFTYREAERRTDAAASDRPAGHRRTATGHRVRGVADRRPGDIRSSRSEEPVRQRIPGSDVRVGRGDSVPDRQVPSRRRAIADRRFDTRRRRQRSSSRCRQRHRRPTTQFATRRAGDVAMDRAAARRRGSGQPRPHVGTHRGGHQRRREPAAEVRQGVVRPGRRTTTTASPSGRVAPRWSTSRSPSSRSATCW